MKRLPLAGKLGPDTIMSAVERGAVEMAREGAGPVEIAGRCSAWLTEATELAMQQFPPVRPIGCKSGCAYCCHLKVVATVPEVLCIIDHVQRTLSPEGLASFRARVSEANAAVGNVTADERARRQVPCPLLDGSHCVAYENRPLHCAGANSFDPASCEDAFRRPDEDVAISHYPAQRLAAGSASVGLSRALFTIGLDGRVVELVAALHLALTDPSAADRWNQGEPAFEAAVDRELVAMLERRRLDRG
ncbi:MAG: YkgJ family cysteine cluster protein [Polyangiaceae bacterium]|nr:YkgJ family cysteine cluster protein [Polyangiaceae bacterium]